MGSLGSKGALGSPGDPGPICGPSGGSGSGNQSGGGGGSGWLGSGIGSEDMKPTFLIRPFEAFFTKVGVTRQAALSLMLGGIQNLDRCLPILS
jgi:hypothetical protein